MKSSHLVRIPASKHKIPHHLVSGPAIKTINRLIEAGFQAYLVGGGVRDLLLGMTPKDFDISTDARPEQVVKLFRKARVIGRRFRIAHVYYGREIIEVTTFRGHHPDSDDDHPHAIRSATGQLLRDNIYGSLEEDAIRRDFTANALYYDTDSRELLDYTNAYQDIQTRILRTIGDPRQRYHEDPVRMLRAARFAAKLDFEIEESSAAEVIKQCAHLDHVPAARLFDETLKLFMSGYGEAAYRQLKKFHLFENLFPQTQRCMDNGGTDQLITQALINTDQRLAAGKGITPAFFYSVVLWPPLMEKYNKILAEGASEAAAIYRASQQVISDQVKITSIPRRFSIPMREIWELQGRLTRCTRQRVVKLSQHPRFRAAYDFLLLREQSGEQTDGRGQWWTEYQEADNPRQREMIDALGSGNRRRKRKPRKSRAQRANKTPPP